MLTAYYADIVRNYNGIIRNYLLSLLFVTRTTMVAGTEILKSGDQTNLDKKILVAISVVIWSVWFRFRFQSWNQTSRLGLKTRILVSALIWRPKFRRLCPSVSLHADMYLGIHTSEFHQIFCACHGRGSLLFGSVAICYVLPVLRLTSRMHIMARNGRREKSVHLRWLARWQHGYDTEANRPTLDLPEGGIWRL